ncbi:hypothetical protein ACQKQD_32380 [Methylobacterium sp. NPDC080182]|uniref:hypothetical protein n=1 Tax=Methylobacterium sp. NPDC080182 TaxID=3390590 RepID=UPI003D09426C
MKAAIEEVVQDELGRFGVREIEVRPDEDHDGDPAIYVVIHYAAVDADPDPENMSNTMFKLNNRLYAMNEKRFAHVSHVVPEPPKRVRAR